MVDVGYSATLQIVALQKSGSDVFLAHAAFVKTLERAEMIEVVRTAPLVILGKRAVLDDALVSHHA